MYCFFFSSFFYFFFNFYFSPSKPELLKAFGYARKHFASDKPGIFKRVPVLLQCLQLRPILLTKHKDGISHREAIKASPWQGCTNVYILNPCLHGCRRAHNSSEKTLEADQLQPAERAAGRALRCLPWEGTNCYEICK